MLCFFTLGLFHLQKYKVSGRRNRWDTGRDVFLAFFFFFSRLEPKDLALSLIPFLCFRGERTSLSSGSVWKRYCRKDWRHRDQASILRPGGPSPTLTVTSSTPSLSITFEPSSLPCPTSQTPSPKLHAKATGITYSFGGLIFIVLD